MPLYRLLQNCAFEPLQIEVMAYAFEATCIEKDLRPDDPLREVVAQKVIEYAQRGERDPARLRDLVLSDIKEPA
jgi:hypothetical protein